jgi:hypothetical protein
METGGGAVGETAALGEAEAAVGGTAERGLKLVQHKGPGARGRRREFGSWSSRNRREQERRSRRL